MKNWEEAARTIQRKDKYKLTSLPGGWLIRKKFTVEAQEGLLQFKDQVSLDAEGNPENVEKGSLREFHKYVIESGLLEFHFKAEDENEDQIVDIRADDFMDKILEHPDIETEIFKSIMELNAPLAEGSNSESETAQNGSSKANSSGKAKNSPTEQTQV